MYGVQPTGFVRKPLSQILIDIESALSAPEIFGAGVIQSSESPLGQINGIFADQVNELWELSEDIYNSLDPDQAEGTRLDSLARLRLLERNGLSNIDLRTSISNVGVNKFNIKGIEQELESVAGITYLQAFLNDDGSLDSVGLNEGDIAIAVIGGDDGEIADTLLRVVGTGSILFGNTQINSTPATGIDQQFNITRVSEVPVELIVRVRLINDTFDQFEPDPTTVANGIATEWMNTRINGRDVNEFSIERIIYCLYPNLRLNSFTATLNGTVLAQDADAVIAFDEIAEILAANITVVFE